MVYAMFSGRFDKKPSDVFRTIQHDLSFLRQQNKQKMQISTGVKKYAKIAMILKRVSSKILPVNSSETE